MTRAQMFSEISGAIASAPKPPLEGCYKLYQYPLNAAQSLFRETTCRLSPCILSGMQPSMVLHPTQIYQFRILEYLEDELAAWFNPLTIAHEVNGVTTLL